MTPEPLPAIIAIITGERGHREIVRPLAAVGVHCLVLDWTVLRARSRSPYPGFIRAVAHLIRARPGAIVFTDMDSAFLAVILLIARRRRSRVLLRLRGDPVAEARDQFRFHWSQREWPQCARAGLAWLLDRTLFLGVSRFVPVSHWIVRRLRLESRSTVVRIPVSLADFPPREHHPASLLKLLAVTNFNYPQKVAALGRFIDDYGEYLQQHETTLTVAGGGIAWEEFRTRYAGRAEFLGFVPDVASLYATHDAFVHFSDLDAFPYVVLEAQASALPVLVNRDCGMIEQVEHDLTGLIVDLPIRASVETRLAHLREPAFRTRLGVTARDHVAETYSLEMIGRDLVKALTADDDAQSADRTWRTRLATLVDKVKELLNLRAPSAV